jgi:hypothetical protein
MGDGVSNGVFHPIKRVLLFCLFLSLSLCFPLLLSRMLTMPLKGVSFVILVFLCTAFPAFPASEASLPLAECSGMDRFRFDHQALLDAATFYEDIAQDRKALECFKAAAEVSAKFPGGWAELARFQTKLHHTKDAIQVCA